MALGKAFIEVHADTAPFARELASELDKIVRASGKEVKVSSAKLGETIAKDTGKGISKNKRHINNGVDEALTGTLGLFARFAKGIVDTIDDGLSGLPAELKLILGAALVGLLPLVIAFGSAVVAALTGALSVFAGAGIGALLAAQFQEVRDGFAETIGFLRDLFTTAAEPLVRPFLNAFREIRERFAGLAPELSRLFGTIELTIVPVVDALLGFVEQFLPAFRRGFANIGEFLAPLQIGLRLIGAAAGDFFEEILGHEEAPAALFDLLVAVEDLLQFFTELVKAGLDFYGTLRDIFEFLGLVEEYTGDIEVLGKKFGIAAQEESIFGDAVDGTLTPLEAQEQAIEDVNNALQTYIDQQFKAITGDIAFERALDDLTESVDKNGRSLNIQKEAGRQNAEQLLELARIALETRQRNIDMGLGVQFAEERFQAQKAEIIATAKQLKLSKTETDKLIGALLGLPPPIATGVDQASVARLQAAYLWAGRLASRIAHLISLGAAQVVTAAQNQNQNRPNSGPTRAGPSFNASALGPEASIPLSASVGSAIQSLNQVPSAPSSAPQINVYIGNQQLKAYIATESDQRMTAAARAVSYGTRGI